MTEQQFAYWLQGFAELTGDVPTAEQWKSIREHLATVFKKVTPIVGSATTSTVKMDTKSVEDAIRRMQDNWSLRNGGASPDIQYGTGAIC